MAKRSARTPKRDLYQDVTETILGYLEEGVVPWRTPIKRSGRDGLPKSLGAGRPYRGINAFLLAMITWAHGYSSDYWLTFNQAKKLGAAVRKGEKGTRVIFWKQYAKQDEDSGEEVTIPVIKHYTAFNADQVDGFEPPDAQSSEQDQEPFVPIAEAEKIVAGYADPPQIRHGFRRAVYYPTLDAVEMPDAVRFTGREAYYATLFHELAHSTGHAKRLRRGLAEKIAPFGSPDYSKEELVAEFGAAFCAAVAGISPPTIEQSAAYIDGWKKQLADDKKLVVQAAGLGQRAADRILGVTFDDDEPAATKG